LVFIEKNNNGEMKKKFVSIKIDARFSEPGPARVPQKFHNTRGE